MLTDGLPSLLIVSKKVHGRHVRQPPAVVDLKIHIVKLHPALADLAERFGVSTHSLAKVLRTLSAAGLVQGGRGASGGYRFTGNRRRITLMDIVALFEPAPGSRAKEPGEDTEIGAALQRILTEIDEIAEATLRSVSLETMLVSSRAG